MKRAGLLHAELNAIIAIAGHTQMIVIADAGLPIPNGVRRIDLAVVAGLPDVISVLKAVLDELVLESSTISLEANLQSVDWVSQLHEVLPQPPQEISHEALKALLPQVLAVVRTGETTPYANIVLHCGVNFSVLPP